jgi:hypothetical protein
MPAAAQSLKTFNASRYAALTVFVSLCTPGARGSASDEEDALGHDQSGRRVA